MTIFNEKWFLNRKLKNSKLEAKKSKYNNKKCIGNDNFKYDSNAEMSYYYELSLRQKAGEILDISRQVKFALIPSYSGIQQKIDYIADFVIILADGTIQVIDVKSKITAKNSTYILKKKLMWHVHGIQIKEIIK